MKLGFIYLASALLFGSMALSQANPAASPQTAPSQAPARVALPPSPVVQPDGTVTFRLLAPGASSVNVNGQLYPSLKKGQQAGMPMTKDERGVWSITIGPLPAEFYDYYYIVDGVRALDPANQHVAYGTNWFLVPGGVTANYLNNDVPHGTVSLVWYPSPTLGMARRRMTVYTPPGYEDSTAHYPVLYLLHGGGASEHTWWESGRTPEVLDNLIAQGKALPMIVVFPNGNETQAMTNADADNPVPNGPPQAQPTQPGQPAAQRQPGPLQTTSMKFPDSLVNDIIPYIDKHYRTNANRDNRAIIGLSLGASQTILTAFHHLDTFAWVGLFSGDMPQIPGATPDLGGKLHTFYWASPNEPGSDAMIAGKKILDQAGIKYIVDSRPLYSSEFWRSGQVGYFSQLFKPDQSPK